MTGSTRLRWTVGLGMAVVTTVSANAASIGIGINYNWWRLNLKEFGDCTTIKEKPAMVFKGGGILPQYDIPSVRATVQRQLLSMRQAGYTTIRTFVSLRDPTPNNPLTGFLTSSDGSLSAENRQRIQGFIGDIAAAGFRTIEISFGFSRENHVYCRRPVLGERFGDCFEPQRIEENWRWISDVSDAVLQAAGDAAVRFDLGNEMCPAPSMPKATLENAKRYVAVIASRFQARFGSRWLFSCPDGPNRLTLLAEHLAAAGLQPQFIEIHTYRTDPRHIAKLLDTALAVARPIGARIIIGEMRYHSKEQANALRNWMQRHPDAPLIDMIEWPLAYPNPGSRCAVDTAPPYVPSPSLKALAEGG